MKTISTWELLRKTMRPSRPQAPRPWSFRPRLEILEDRTVPSAPSVTGVAPNYGPIQGSTEVQVTGSGFTGASVVDFGNHSAEFFLRSDTLIEAFSPGAMAGTVDVTVTTPGGTSATSSADWFTYGTATTTSLSSSANPSTYNQSVTFTATVTGNGGTPTGTVWFNDGGNVIGSATLNGSGVATFTTSALAVESHSITAVYGGNAQFFGSTSSALTQTVQTASTTTTLSSDSQTAGPGQAVTFTAEVDGAFGGAPTGTVTFYDGTTSLGTATLSPGGQGGEATLTISTLAAGSHAITASYGGDANYNGSNASALNETIQNNGAYVWTGDDLSDPTDWNDAANWLVDGVTPTTAPGDNNDVVFGVAAGGTDNNCSATGAVSVNSLSINSDYTGALSLYSTLTVAAGFDLEGGAVNQVNGAGASDITVNGSFNWIGGVLNVGDNLANIFLGGHATLAGTNLTTKDNLVIGLFLSFRSTGTLTFNGDGGITLNRGSLFSWDTPTGSIATAGAGSFENRGGQLVTGIRVGNNRVTCALPYDGTSGILNVPMGTLAFTGAFGGTGAQAGLSAFVSGGSIRLGTLGAGTTLEVDHGLTMTGGQLTTGAGQTCTIAVGDVTISGGAQVTPGDLNGIGELDCDGLVTLDGGTYNANVDLMAQKASKWYSAKGFNIGGAAELSVDSVNVPAAAALLPKKVNFIILSTPVANDIPNDFAANNKLGLLIGNTGVSYTAGPDAASPNRFYYLSL